jgi:hypothetical protein
MKNVFVVLFLFGLMTLPGCSWFSNVGCSVESAASGAISSALSKSLNCANPAQVLVDVTALVAKTNICQAPAAKLPSGLKGGTIASLICPTLANLATAELGSKIPAAWQCSVTSSSLDVALTSACNLIPF